jgi:hypothetical protein
LNSRFVSIARRCAWIRIPVNYEKSSPSELIGGQLIDAIAQIPPTDRRMIPPRSIQLSAQQGYVIKENIKDMHIKQVPRTKMIRIGDKVPSDIGLHDFLPLVVEKVPKVKTYKFFITENQIVLVNPQNEIADIIK